MIQVGEVLGIKELKSRLPWRYPMLLLDRVTRESETHFVGFKNLTVNELYFQGHFPNRPIMPGVLQVETMKQLCELIVRKELDPTGMQDVYLKKLQKVKFRNPAEPGDRLFIDAELLELTNTEATLQVKVSNATGITSEGRLTVAARPCASPETMPARQNEYDRVPGKTAMEIGAIRKAMPHRYPFLLIDNIVTLDDNSAVAVKNLTITEEVFNGSKADCRTFPESLMCEIVAQVGCASILSRAENAGKLGLFAAIPNAESFGYAVPGDQLVCKVELPAPNKAFGKGTGAIYVGEKKIFEMSLMFAVVEA